MQDHCRRECSELAEVNPEPNELMEKGYYSQATSELMRDSAKAVNEEWEGYNEQWENLNFECDLREAMKSGIYVSGATGTEKVI